MRQHHQAPQPEQRGIEDIGGGGGHEPTPEELDIEEEQNRAEKEAIFTPEETALKPPETGEVKEPVKGELPDHLIPYNKFLELGTKTNRGAFINKMLSKYPDLVVEDGGKSIGHIITRGKHAGNRQMWTYGGIDDYTTNLLYQNMIEVLGHRGVQPMEGRGLVLKKSPRMKGKGLAHLVEAPYEKPKLYTQFGRYLINKPKLASSILSLRTPAGGMIRELPPQRMSPTLHSVVSTLVGSGLPSYEHISKLTDDDRDKLVEICRVCHIEVPSVPKSTNMDNEEKENYRFEVLKGELFAGNNSPKIVKEFKTLLLKFINRGKVPRREGHEILQNLIELGL